MPSNTSDNTPAGTNFRAEFLQIHVSKTTKVAALETFLLDKFTDASLGVHIFFQKLSFEIRPRGNGVLSRALYNMLPGENSALTAKLSQQARRVVRGRQHVFPADEARQGNNSSIPLVAYAATGSSSHDNRRAPRCRVEPCLVPGTLALAM